MRLSCEPLLLLPLCKLGGDGPLAGGVGAVLGSRGHAVQAEGELGSSPAGGLGVEGEGAPVDVLDGVTLEVVAGVRLRVGAGEETGRGDTELDEGDVVGRCVKLPIPGQSCSAFQDEKAAHSHSGFLPFLRSQLARISPPILSASVVAWENQSCRS